MLERQGYGGILKSFLVPLLRIGAARATEAHDDWTTENGDCREEVAEHYFVLQTQWSEHAGFNFSFYIQAR